MELVELHESLDRIDKIGNQAWVGSLVDRKL